MISFDKEDRKKNKDDKNNMETNEAFSYIPFLRNVGIIAHIDSGKTTTTERILYLCKQIHKIGEVHEGSTQTDFLELEKERGITICSAAVTVDWSYVGDSIKDGKKTQYKLNIIDTPGHLDFKAEVERCLRVLDGVILVMDGKEGVEPQTETVWRQASKYHIPRIIFVNKMDGVESEDRFYNCLVSIRKSLRAIPIPVQIPIGAGRNFQGVVDLLEKKAYFFKFGDKDENFVVADVPSYLLEKVNLLRQDIIDNVIVFDEVLGLEYLENEGKKELETDKLRLLLRKAVLTGKYFPVFCGSAYQDVGVNLLLNGVLDYLPSPADARSVSVYSLTDSKKKEEEEKEEDSLRKISCFDSVSYLALAFKTIIDVFGNTLTFIRVYAGQIKTGSFIYNVVKNKEERVSTLVRMNANEETRISVVRAGEIAAIKGLKYTRTGDTFFDNKKQPIVLEPIVFDKPVISKALVPSTSKDGERLVKALKEMCFEDPSINFYKDDRSGQIVAQGMGILHLEVLEENLRRKYKLKIATEEPKIAYKETIKNRCETWTRYKKQSGGHGHFADINLLFEPNPGKGFEFVNKIRGESVSKVNAEAVGKGLEEAFSNGLLIGCTVVDVKVSLLDGLQHSVDSSDKDFKQAAIIACRENKEKLGLTLLEPIVHVLVLIPKECMKDVMANLLGSARMVIENSEELEEGEVRIVGRAPLEKMISYTTILRQLTKGRGNCIASFSHYQEVPQDILQRVVKEHNVS